MKKLITLAAVILLSCSCSRDIDRLNRNTKDLPNVSGASLFTTAQKALVDQITTADYNYNVFRLFCQYWTQNTYTRETYYNLNKRSVSFKNWRALYKDVLGNLEASKKRIREETSDADVKNNKLRIVELMEIYAWSVLVDTYGDIPYKKASDSDNSKSKNDGLHSEALNIDNLAPQFDDSEKIYEDLLKRIDKAISLLKPGKKSFSEKEDNIYQGKVEQWVKFANSLKLRMAITLSDANSTLAANTISSIKGGLIANNSDNAELSYLATIPNTNPTYKFIVATGRADFNIAKTLVDEMNKFKDPREKYYFKDNKVKVDEDAAEATKPQVGHYKGLLYGQTGNYGDYTQINDTIKKPMFPGTILSASEVEFLLAEAAARGYAVGGPAASHYRKAIERSFEEWGGTAKEADDYIKNHASIDYDVSKWKEQIGTQAWIALYNRGFAGWLFLRRLDYPVLKGPHTKGEKPTTQVPVRYTYPRKEYLQNGANVNKVAKKIGDDKLSTKIFWDKN